MRLTLRNPLSALEGRHTPLRVCRFAGSRLDGLVDLRFTVKATASSLSA
jgi:hypothetical protein